MDATQVKAWRRQERTRLIAMRMGIPPAARREWGALITGELEAFLTERAGALGVFWPFRAEKRPVNADWSVQLIRRFAAATPGLPSDGRARP
jgi:hypothetical protein